ncbi:MAG: hypothetical protein KAH00_06425 [Cocleimonas sp.]|nr:hypothetical protein [Cocleimonas sp.]
MKKRTFNIDCTRKEPCQKLYKILTLFINTAFPPNGSDCAQATRASLLVLCDKIKNSSHICEMNKRQRPLLKTAITWYFETVEVSENSQQQALLLLIAKRSSKRINT